MNESEVFAVALVEAAPDAVVVLDARGTIHLVNARTESLLRHPRTTLVGRPLETLLRAGHVGVLALQAERRARRALGGVDTRPVEFEVFSGDGAWVPVEATLAPLALGGATFTIVAMRDRTERRALEMSLRYRSSHDALTGLENRGAFDEALHRLSARGPAPVGVLMADVDGLKTVNDRLGHAAGDELLRRAARVLRETFRSGDVVARIGGDEFAVLAPGQDAPALERMRERLDEVLQRVNQAEPAVPLQVSVGIAVADERQALRAAVRDADEKMYLTKRAHHS